jgi:parallel beta-helix repeat protein
MKKSILTAVLILGLSFSAIAGTPLVRFSSANFFPEPAPSGIQITSAGTVEGTDLIQRSGNVYTLTGDIQRTIVVMRDDIVLDGAGYTLQGSGSGSGVFLQERNGVTIKNLRIKNFEVGIKFTWRSYGQPPTPRSNKVASNTITNNTYGVVFYDFSTESQVTDNYISGNTYGVSASNAVFRNNQFKNNGGAIMENSYALNDIDTSNTVNGKPIYYWIGEHDRSVPSDAGWVVLRNCSRITVQGLSLQGNGDGISLYYTNDSTVTSNAITKNINGIKLSGSYNNLISDNHIASNTKYGIYLDGASKGNNIISNKVESNGKDGISVYALGYLNGNMVSQNEVTGNLGNGISVNGAQGYKIVENNITLNEAAGISFLYGSSGNTVNASYIAGNGVGILLSNAIENTITSNTITENNGWGIELNGSQKNNVIHHNNFINNHAEGLQVRIAGVFDFPDFNQPPTNYSIQPHTEPPNEPEPPKFVAGAANVWDDGTEGNYWSDYGTRYPNASEVGNTGVGDTPFFINENNIDRHPLMAPCETSTAELPATTPPQEPGAEPEPFPTTLLIFSAASAVTIGLGLTLHFMKRKHKQRNIFGAY